jgi:hypothetical protein
VSFEFEEAVMEDDGNCFQVDPYDARGWALVDSGAHVCTACCDLWGIELETY